MAPPDKKGKRPSGGRAEPKGPRAPKGQRTDRGRRPEGKGPRPERGPRPEGKGPRPERGPRPARGGGRPDRRGSRPEGREPRPERRGSQAGVKDYKPQLVATCALGLELTVGRELEALGLGPITRDNAQVSFPFTPHAVAKANYWLRTADRVWLQLGQFPCRDFEELFQGLQGVEWSELLPRDASFPIEVISTKSKLESVSACQSVGKKAVVEKLRQAYGAGTFPETGPVFAIRVFIVYDHARVFIDTSGEGLHRRGYRTYNAKAPLRETVAAALVLLSHWSAGRDLYDPLCGSGTILLEAACIGLRKAAGVERSFASQRWKFLGRECWEEVHKEALDLFDRRTQLRIYGSDNDARVLKLARTHLEQSGLDGRGIHLQNRDVADFSSKRKHAVMITNPPYGRRLSSEEEVEELTRLLAQTFEPMADTWSLYYYTAFERFAEVYGRAPDRVRKIYNGRIPASLLQYPGPKPPSWGSGGDPGGTEPIRKRIPLNP